MFLKEFRDRAHGLPDLLPFAALVDEGVVLTKSGGFLAAFEFRGPDLDSATAAELGAMASRVNGALKLDDGWAIFVDAVRTPAPGYMSQGAFPDRTTRLLDDVRRLSHEADDTAGFESRFYLTVLWHPEPDAASKVEATFIEGRGESGTAARSLMRFKQALAEIGDRMSGVVKIRQLVDTTDGGDIKSELLGHLQACVTFDQRGPYRLPEVPMYLDALIGRRPFVTGFEPKVGKTTVIPVSIIGFPGRSFPGMLDFLSRLPVEYRWSNRFIYLNERQADKVLSGYRSKWGQKRLSLMNLIKSNTGGQVTHMNLDADEMANDAVVALSENSGGIVRFGYYTSTILLHGENPQLVRESARRVVKQVVNIGFDARIEEVNAVEAYLGSIPGNIVANVRRPLINTANLSHLLPMTAVWPGLHSHPCPFYPANSPVLLQAQTDGATPYRLCLHAGDLGHTAIIGPTGSGKSTLVGTLAAQHFRYPNARVFAFDKGYSMQPLVLAAGGQHYDIAGDANDIAFCPLAAIDRQAELEWATEWVELLCELQGVTMTPEYRKEILRALKQLADSTTNASQRTITNFVLALQDQTLRDAVNQYTLSGIGGRLLDAESDALQEDIFQVFEMEHLLNRGDRIVLPVLSYLFHRLEQRFNGEPTLLILDEAWILLGHPIFKAKIREWLKVLRKRNVAVVFATQSLSDLSRSGIADVIYESCPSKILLANAEAATDALRPLYQAIGINERQIQIIAQMTPKRHYYHLHPDGRRLFDLGLTPPELAFVGASDKESLTRMSDLRRLHGDAWPAQWLRERGQFDAATVWESY
jgi:type IV secretion system protein VirB4